MAKFAVLLFVAQAALFGYFISDSGRQADYARDRLATCSSQSGENERLGCISAGTRDIASAESNQLYGWIGLGIGSALTLFGAWRGLRRG